VRILLAYDGSDGSRRALDTVAGLAGPTDHVTIVGVAEGVPLFGHAATLPSSEQEAKRDRELAAAEAVLAERGLPASLVPRGGDAATAILEVAEQEGVELIAMGTRGLSIAERWLMGSVSDRVLHHAPCSVLVAR